jgi:hypothetical protein
MELANTIIGALGDILVLIAIIVAVRTLADAKQSDLEATRDRLIDLLQSSAMHRLAGLDRERDQLIQIGQLIEEIKLSAPKIGDPADRYRFCQAQLGRLLVGRQLPACAKILDCSLWNEARTLAEDARPEVDENLAINWAKQEEMRQVFDNAAGSYARVPG